MSYTTDVNKVKMGHFQPGNLLASFINKIGDGSTGYRAPLVERRMLLIAVDVLCIFVAVWGAHLFWSLSTPANQTVTLFENWYWFPLMLGGWVILASFNDLYDVPSSYRKVTSAKRVVATGLLGLLSYLGVFFLLPELLPRVFFLAFLMLAVPLIIAWRWAYAACSPIINRPHHVLIVGEGERGQSIAKLLQNTSRLNFQVLGFVDNDVAPSGLGQKHLPVLGAVADLPRLVQQKRVHEVVVATEQALTEELFHLLIECQSHGVQVSWMPDLYEKLCRSIPIEHIDATWALYAMQGQPIFSRIQLVGKRLLDLAIVLFSLPMLMWIFPVVALLVRLDSPGPIFYRQIRSGRGGVPFSIIKFRTMVQDAEKAGQPVWATKGDMRITRIGRILRKARLDELPQILNILRGDMSIVGPRPERPEFVKTLEQAIPFYRIRLLVKPGLTGWAQVHYDYGNTQDDARRKLEYDFYYIRYWSLWRDLYTMFRTISVVFKLKGM